MLAYNVARMVNTPYSGAGSPGGVQTYNHYNCMAVNHVIIMDVFNGRTQCQFVTQNGWRSIFQMPWGGLVSRRISQRVLGGVPYDEQTLRKRHYAKVDLNEEHKRQSILRRHSC